MINEGEFIYLYHEKSSYLVSYYKKMQVETHKGRLIIPEDANYGDIVYTNTNEPFIILYPTLSDLMFKVKRKTTIIYPREAGTIILELGIQSGSKVIEIGTGSGSFTLLLSRICGENGKVYTFERNEEHLKNAKKNLERLGCFNNIEYFLIDPIENNGFGITNVDAIFIDVPAPWTLVEHAYNALKGGGHIGFLSPNIEQVQTTVEELEKKGFTRIRCMEILSRGIRVKKNLTRPYDRMIGHTGYIYFAEKVNKVKDNDKETEY